MIEFTICLFVIPVFTILSLVLDRRSAHAGDVAMLWAYVAAAFAFAFEMR